MTDASTLNRPGVGDASFRVPKDPVSVSLTLEGGLRVRGRLYLCPEAGGHAGRERVLELLTSDAPFLPVTDETGTRLVNKRRIVTLEIEDRYDAELEEEETGPGLEVPVLVHLCGVSAEAALLEGRIALVMPPGHLRLLDYLNAAGRFFPVLTGPSGVTLCSVKHVVAVRGL
jgi:hypothetical protein